RSSWRCVIRRTRHEGNRAQGDGSLHNPAEPRPPSLHDPTATRPLWHEMAVVGRIARAHGTRGQVIVNLETDFPERRFQVGAELFVERRGAVESLMLTAVRFQHERPVIAVAGVDTMDAAEALAGLELR